VIAWSGLVFSLLLIAYPFLGYTLLLFLRARYRPKPILRHEIEPSLTVVIAAHNEERIIRRKLDNIFASDYPGDKIEVIVVSDGSTDLTNEILSTYSDSRLRAIKFPQRCGKAAALNSAIKETSGEIVVFTDARQLAEKSAIRSMVSNFADPSVGCVSGALVLGKLDQLAGISGEGLKWGLENKIREWEGLTNSVVGALGAFHAARRNLLVSLPSNTLLDDCYEPLSIVRQGYRTVFDERARAWDDVVTTASQEFRRKVRTLTGNYQLIREMPWLLSLSNPVWFEFVSHKVCRLILPVGFVGILISVFFLPGPVAHGFGCCQLAGYALGAIALFEPKLGPLTPVADIARTVVIMNAAAVMAFINWLRGNNQVWSRDHSFKQQHDLEPGSISLAEENASQRE
jgi:biofilm PGA synthesis N-glycosyltransferase PgaC